MNNLDSKTFNFNIVRANSINNTNHTNSTNSTNSTRPTLWVISPVNDGSYNTSQVLLNASSNQTVAWSYTLNGHAYSKGVGSRLVTVMNASNGLVNGVNTLIITISNANGTVTRTKDFIVNLNGNSNIPVIQILSPRNGQNYTLNVSTIPLRVISNQPMSNWNYSLNGVWNLSFVPNTVLKNVFNGTHVLIVCGRNANGSICNTSIFNVVSNISNPAGPAPVITIVDPIEGHTYNTANIPFKVTSNQPIIQWAYSLNGGTPVIFATPNNSTFSLNQILTLVNGNYALWAYGSNFNGSTGSDVRHFSVSITSPHDDDDDEDNDSDEDFMDVPVTNFTLGSNNFNGVITLGSNNTKPYFDWILFLKTVSLWILILILLILIVIVSILIVRNLQN